MKFTLIIATLLSFNLASAAVPQEARLFDKTRAICSDDPLVLNIQPLENGGYQAEVVYKGESEILPLSSAVVAPEQILVGLQDIQTNFEAAGVDIATIKYYRLLCGAENVADFWRAYPKIVTALSSEFKTIKTIFINDMPAAPQVCK